MNRSPCINTLELSRAIAVADALHISARQMVLTGYQNQKTECGPQTAYFSQKQDSETIIVRQSKLLDSPSSADGAFNLDIMVAVLAEMYTACPPIDPAVCIENI